MTVAIAIPPEVTAAIGVAQQAVAAAQHTAAAVMQQPINTPELAQWATDVAHQINAQKKGFEAERDRVAKPLRKIASDHSAQWKPAIEACDHAIRHLKSQVLMFQNAQRVAQQAALKAAAQEAAATGETTAIAAAAKPVAKPKGMTTVTDWAWEVADRSKVPAEYFVLDVSRLNAEAKLHKDKLNIPGIRPRPVQRQVLR